MSVLGWLLKKRKRRQGSSFDLFDCLLTRLSLGSRGNHPRDFLDLTLHHQDASLQILDTLHQVLDPLVLLLAVDAGR